MDSDLMRWVKAQADDPDANPRFRELLAALEAAQEDAIKWRKYGYLFKKMSDVAETMAPVIQFRIELQEAAKKAKELINE